MAKFIETVQTTVTKSLVTIILTAIGTMMGVIWLAIQDPLANIFIDVVPRSIILILPLFLLLLLALAVIYIIYLRKKMKNPIEDYEFDEKIGILHNPKDNFTYCLSCLHNGIKSPLKVQENGWHCQNKDCNKFYINPDYKSPPVYQPIHSSRNWINDWNR